jgi:hypothetical protein
MIKNSYVCCSNQNQHSSNKNSLYGSSEHFQPFKVVVLFEHPTHVISGTALIIDTRV